ncbi:MAG: uracil-DNA glycosylase family 4 [Parasphingorhabdus sp.]|jgi:uracil-DNA glycosylase family 4
MNKKHFDIDCRQCERLADFLDEVKLERPDYYCRPVPPFGDPSARLLIVGLAPGKHGANATGRPFTGDHAGILLYQTLHKFGFSSAPESSAADDDLQLLDCRISNAVKCLPPQNKPVTAEIRTCIQFISHEIKEMPRGSVILALGSIAHNAVLWCKELKISGYKFGHGSQHDIGDGHTLLSSYHCSRYNTQTRRLTEPMFHDVFRAARQILEN